MKPKSTDPSRYHTAQFFERQPGTRPWTSEGDRCINCGRDFMDHYNGYCPKEENDEQGKV